MTGAMWALAAGVGFGVFQSLNRRAVSGMDIYLATFMQLLISALVLGVASLFTVDVRLLSRAPLGALINFALAGLFHFFIGWTLLNLSQKQIGAARTGPLIGATPLFAAALAALTLQELPTLLSLAGILLMVGGVYLVSSRPAAAAGTAAGAGRSQRNGSLFGLAAAFCWAISPIFIRQGLKGLPSPLLGVTVGMMASAAGYGLPLVWQWARRGTLAASADAWLFKVLAGILVGLSTWARWIALDLAGVAVVLAVSLVSVPVVIVLAPVVSGRRQEPVTGSLWAGAGLILGGALLLIMIS